MVSHIWCNGRQCAKMPVKVSRSLSTIIYYFRLRETGPEGPRGRLRLANSCEYIYCYGLHTQIIKSAARTADQRYRK